MEDLKIAVSTGEIDKRTINGNNGVKRGKDSKPRRPPSGYFVLKDEVRAGLRARLNEVIAFYGSPAKMARAIGVPLKTVSGWMDRGMISADGAGIVQKAYRRDGFVGFRASYCRPDLKFDNNGKALERKCTNRKMLRMVTRAEAEAKHKAKESTNS